LSWQPAARPLYSVVSATGRRERATTIRAPDLAPRSPGRLTYPSYLETHDNGRYVKFGHESSCPRGAEPDGCSIAWRRSSTSGSRSVVATGLCLSSACAAAVERDIAGLALRALPPSPRQPQLLAALLRGSRTSERRAHGVSRRARRAFPVPRRGTQSLVPRDGWACCGIVPPVAGCLAPRGSCARSARRSPCGDSGGRILRQVPRRSRVSRDETTGTQPLACGQGPGARS
jgi:hypothetical protein